MTESVELCEMCEHYLTKRCPEERRVLKRNEDDDGFKIKIQNCEPEGIFPGYQRVTIKRDAS